jgi:hypothetical protein
MATLHARVKSTVEELLAVVKQLSPAELHRFEQELAAWRERNGKGRQVLPTKRPC